MSKIYSIGLALILILAENPVRQVQAQTLPEPTTAPAPVVEWLRIGPHPEYTRILLGLSQTVPYEVIPDFKSQEVRVFIPGAQAAEALRSKSFKDRFLGPIQVLSLENGVHVTFGLKNQNTRVFHYMQRTPATLVLDFQGTTDPVLQTQIGKPATAPAKKTKKADVIPGLNEEQVRQLVREDAERKLTQGYDDYQQTLQLYQQQKYPEAIKGVDAFEKKFPGSPLLEGLLYLKAEALFQIHNPEPFPVYDEVISAYQYAIRKFPKSQFYDHALYKLGIIFDNLNLPLEARTLYLTGVERDKKSLYNKARQTGLAEMLLREKQYEEAYKAYQEILKTDPQSSEAQKGIFEIAQRLFDQGKLEPAREIFEDGARRWPQQLKEVPGINYYMGEIYFQEKDYEKARRHYFDLLNLAPESENAHKSLNRIGDSYLIQGQGMSALSIFEKSQRLNPETAEAQYAKIRLADIGVRDPTLPVRDVIFDLPEYFKPLETYKAVFQDAKSREILAEVTLSRGAAHMQQKQFLEAIGEFKKLIPLDPKSRHHKNARNFLMQALVLLIEDYANQQGYLPILYVYNDFRNMNIGDIQNVKTLLQIGESYQAIGMYNEALAFFERVKRNDPNGVFRDRLFLNLGRIQTAQGNYAEAEVVARTFLTNFPLSPQVPDAMKILGEAFKGQKTYDEALDIFRQLLARADADASEAHYLMAEVWFQRGNLEEAIREYALTLDTHDRTLRKVADHVKSAYYKLGITLYQIGRYSRALETLISARRLFPDHTLREWADFLIADSYDRTENKDKAVSEFQNMMQSPPDEALLKQAAEIRIKVLDWEKRFKELL